MIVLDQTYTQTILGYDLVTEGISHLGEQMVYLERDSLREL